jgi:hypothetical protein
MVGVFLGAREVALVALATMVCVAVARLIAWTVVRLGGREPLAVDRFGWAGWLCAVTLVRVSSGMPRVGPTDEAWYFAGAGLAIALVAVLSRYVTGRQLESQAG